MALIKCPECGREISTLAETCPHCGYPIKNTQKKVVSYEQQTVKIRCWGRGQNKLNKKLLSYTRVGWEIVSIVEDHWQGGMISPVYKVVLKRAK